MATVVADADVEVHADVSQFAKELERKLRPITRAITATIDVLADSTLFQREVDRQVAEAESVRAQIEVDANTRGIPGEVATTRRQIDNGPHATLHVDVDVDRRAITTATGSFSRQFERIGGESGRRFASSATDSIVSGLRPLQSILPQAIANPVTIGVAAIVAALLAIPAAAAVAATALAGLGLGFIGLGAFALRGNKEVQNAFKDMADRIGNTFESAAEPLVGPLVKAFDTIGDAVERIGPQLREAFEAVAPAIDDLAEGFAGFIENVMPGLVDALEASAPLLEALAKELPGLGEAFSDFFEILSISGPGAIDGMTLLVGLLKAALIILASTVTGLALAFGVLVAAGKFVIDLFSSLFTAVTGLTFSGLAEDIRIFVFQSLTALGEFIQGAIGTVTRFRAEFTGGMQNAITEAQNFVINGLNTIIAFVTSVPGRVSAGLSGLFSAVTSPFVSAFNSARNAAATGIQSIVNLAASIPSRVQGAVGNLSGVLVGAGRSIIQGLINGIQQKIGELRSVLGAVTRLIPIFKGPEDVDKKLLTPAGRFIMEGLIAGIDEGVGDLRRKLSGVTAMFGSPELGVAMAGASSAVRPAPFTSGASSTTNTRTISPTINITMTADDPNMAANAVVRRLLALGV